MYELNKLDLHTIAGGCDEAPDNVTDIVSNSILTWNKLQAGAAIGAIFGAIKAYHYNASPVSYIPFIISGHFSGMIVEAAIKFAHLTKKRITTGDRTIVPIRDAFCK
ncbi:MAG: hypothetical protein U1E78_09145 [Gammaproteobacteria bacterium]